MSTDDLDVAVELVNTYWVLADPPDSLTDTGVVQRILRDAGPDAGRLAERLAPADLAALRALRDELPPLFAAADLPAAAGHLNRLLAAAPAAPRLTVTGDHAEWAVDAGPTAVDALRARLLTAIANHLVRHGATRLGVCHAEPCTCVYVDRSRARTRRYCCDQCNDRAAARAYRRRTPPPPPPVSPSPEASEAARTEAARSHRNR